jgi:hypothetical protein
VSRQTVRAYGFGVTLEQLSEGVRGAIERGTDRIARAARRGAAIGATFGAMLSVLLVGVGVLIGRTF